MPQQAYVLGAALVGLFVFGFATVVAAALSIALPCPAANSALHCAALLGVNTYAVTVLLLGTLRTVWLALALAGHALADAGPSPPPPPRRWLPALTPRAALEGMNRNVGFTLISYAPV
jgi:hypothetical protein